jgi:hypothetical protein
MLADPRGGAFVESFGGQWLNLRELDGHRVDARLFPGFDPLLARAMKEESFRFFAEFVASDRPVQELLTARFTFVDARLAQHYGLAGAGTGGPGLSRVELTTAERGGLLTQASVLTATSAPNETNPVARGNWVLSQLLCAPPPPPPPNVPPAPEGQAAGTTVRARFEAHRTDPVCASCHGLMDPIGFALENYDAIGRFRTTDNGARIDARGQLPDGKTFDGAAELAAVLARDPRFVSCLASNLFTYAVGREPAGRADDGKHLDRIVQLAGSTPGGVTIKKLILALVTNGAFRFRGAEPAAAPGARP